MSKNNLTQKNDDISLQETSYKKKKITRSSVTKVLVGTAMFSALSYVISFLEFPIFGATPFLKLDFSSVFAFLAGFAFGPVSGVAVVGIKELITFFTKSTTGGVGELANFIITSSFILIPTITYVFKKGLPSVIVTMILGCLVEISMSLIFNRFVLFPMFNLNVDFFNTVWYFIALFNLIKTVAISIITILLYKRISNIIKRI